MALNPFAKEFVPVVSKPPTSGLKIATQPEDDQRGTLREAVERRRNRLRGAVEVPALPKTDSQPAAPAADQPGSAKAGGSGTAAPQGELEFDELFRSPSDRSNASSLVSCPALCPHVSPSKCEVLGLSHTLALETLGQATCTDSLASSFSALASTAT